MKFRNTGSFLEVTVTGFCKFHSCLECCTVLYSQIPHPNV